MAPRLLHRVILMTSAQFLDVLSRPRRRALRYSLESGSADAACVPFQANRSFYAHKGTDVPVTASSPRALAPGMNSSTRSATQLRRTAAEAEQQC
jgi:hypothetical protein